MYKITKEQYEELLPFNQKYAKWINDKITARRIFYPFEKYFEKNLMHFYQRDGEIHIISNYEEDSLELDAKKRVMKLITQKPVIFVKNEGNMRFRLEKSHDRGYLHEKVTTLGGVIENIIFRHNMINDQWQTDVFMLLEAKEDDRAEYKKTIYRFYVLNPYGDTPAVEELFVSRGFVDVEQEFVKEDKNKFPKIKELLIKMAKHVPQLTFFAVDFHIFEDDFYIINMHSNPPFPTCKEGFTEKVNKYLYDRSLAHASTEFQIKKQAKAQILADKIARVEDFPKGFTPFLETSLDLTVVPGFNVEITEENWMVERGFMPRRVLTHNITWENQDKFISDFEYEYLGHINNKYRCWFEDKVSIKYLLKDFNENLPAYYYLITKRSGINRIIPLMDSPEGLSPGFEGIFDLVKRLGILALKPDEGTHGAGFLKFTYEDGKYFLNNNVATKEDILELLQDIKNQYLVTEFINQHPVLNDIYPGSVNTARLTVFKKDGKNAQIGNGYLRFGTNATGGVDNIGAGGIGVDLDIETGVFKNPIIVDNEGNFIPCAYHPDTGAVIEGTLPNWEWVKSQVLAMANALDEIEYMGFDVAFTTSGIMLPEINRFPDYPKINKLTPETMNYLLEKLVVKKRLNGF